MRLILLVLAIFFYSCGSRAAAPPADLSGSFIIDLSEEVLSERGADTIKLGRVRSGETVVKDVAIRNSGDVPLVILGLDLTCGCIQATYPKPPLKPGETVAMPLSFDFKGLRGWTYKTVLIRTSLSSRPFNLVVTAQID